MACRTTALFSKVRCLFTAYRAGHRVLSSLSTAGDYHRPVGVQPAATVLSIGDSEAWSSKVISLPSPSRIPQNISLPCRSPKHMPFIPFAGRIGGGLIFPALSAVNMSVPLILPSLPEHKYEKHAHRMLIIRRRKIKKHWRMKRRKRDRVRLLKIHQHRKQSKENAFRERMHVILSEALDFDADAFVRAAIAKAKWRPAETRFPDGRLKYPHWTELMTVEELYQLPETDYIDKNSCLAEDEDWKAIQKLRQEYYAKGYGVPVNNSFSGAPTAHQHS